MVPWERKNGGKSEDEGIKVLHPHWVRIEALLTSTDP